MVKEKGVSCSRTRVITVNSTEYISEVFAFLLIFILFLIIYIIVTVII